MLENTQLTAFFYTEEPLNAMLLKLALEKPTHPSSQHAQAARRRCCFAIFELKVAAIDLGIGLAHIVLDVI